MEPTVFLAVAGVVAAASVVGIAVVRIVPAGHRGVVIRIGRPARTRPPGLVAIVPLVERLQLLPCNPAPIDPLSVSAVTQDGVEVRLVVCVLWSVADPMTAVRASTDVATATVGAVERALHHLAAAVDLATLLRDRESVVSQVPAVARPVVARFGVDLVDVDLLDAEVRLGPQLLRLLS